MKSPSRNPKMPRSLTELQKLMATAVMRPLARDNSMQPKWLDGKPTEKIAETFIKPNDRLTSFERLEIYNQQYWFRLRKCFFSDYPGLRAILGDRKFQRLTDIYLTQNPSPSFTLRDLGSQLVRFLEKNRELIAPRREPASDMAKLEWAYIEAFDNESRPPLTIENIAGLDAAKMRLGLQPHLTLLELKYDLADFLIEIRKNTGLRCEASNAMAQNRRHKEAKPMRGLKRKANFLAVHRFRNHVYFKHLERGEFIILSELQRGATLKKAFAKSAKLKRSGGSSKTIKSWFANWMALGWFYSLKQGRP